MREINITSDLISDLFLNIERADSGCWEWKKWRKPGSQRVSPNYGFIGNRLAHRVMWTYVFGPTSLDVLHNCDNPPCCNPFHLRAGTQAENMRDVALRMRGKRGSRHRNSKLTEDKVRALRQFYRDNSGPQRIWKYRLQSYLKELGVNITTAHRAATGRTWRHVENPYTIKGYNYKKALL